MTFGVIYSLISICLWPIFAFAVLRFFQSEFHDNVDIIDYVAAASLGLIGATLWPLVSLVGTMTFLLIRVTRRADEIKREVEEARR